LNYKPVNTSSRRDSDEGEEFDQFAGGDQENEGEEDEEEGAEEGAEESLESTDSEEDLDSPRLILQTGKTLTLPCAYPANILDH